MADFEIAFDETMINEGGYVDDPDDRGGETYRGVARAIHGDWKGWQIVDRIKQQHPTDFQTHLDDDAPLKDLVKTFYRETFWNVVHGDEIKDQHLANEIFDTGVNQGSTSAIKYWQEALNLLNRNGRDYADLEVDGKVGPKTLESTTSFFARNPGSDALLKVVNLMQGNRYIELARKNPTQRKFMHGWLKRVRVTG